MNRSTTCALALAASFASVACTVKTVDRPVTVTTKQLPEASRPDVVNAAKEVKGESCSRVILLIIPAGFATAESAYADALGQAPGADVLLNYEARASVLVIAPFYYQVCTEVHGFAVSSKALVAASADRSGAAEDVAFWQRKWETEKQMVVRVAGAAGVGPR
jgi:hypothetical protein